MAKRSIRAYRSFFRASDWKKLHNLAARLRGKRIIHVNATPVGGGVAEILQSLIPLQNDLGVKSEWYAIDAPKRFFAITKEMHNGLQGKRFALKHADLDYYRAVNVQLANALSKIDFDIAVIHDPQPLAIIRTYHQAPMISRIHIDASHPDQKLVSLLRPFLAAYEKTVFSSQAFVPAGLEKDRTVILSPAIDPLRAKNRAMPSARASKILRDLGLDPRRPIVTQVSRFDPWKNPMGAIEAYHRAKKMIPEIQLVLIGLRNAKDDPESATVFREVAAAAKKDTDMHVFVHADQLAGYTNEEAVNALQVGSDIILQLSTREGFGLTVAEAMWKRAIVIGGPAAGIRAQIQHGENGFIAKTPIEASRLIVSLLKHPQKNQGIREAAATSVRKHHLMTHQLIDHLVLYCDVLV